MNSTFDQLKKNRKSNFEKLTQELNKASGKAESSADDRFWYPSVDKAGNGYAVIRFLPPTKDEDVPFVRIWEHGFQGSSGSWYIEKSLTTLGKNDPVSEHNSQLWNSGVESDKEIARKQKRKLTFISNVYVIEDPANPENEGKVFLFKYGKKIFDKLYAANNPEFKDESPLDPFDLWEGANFKIKIRQVEGYRNYDRSEFLKPSPLFADEDEMSKVWEKQYSIKTFVDPSQFKSYDDLKTKLERVLGLVGQKTKELISIDEQVISAPKAKETKPKVHESTDEDEIDLDDIMKIVNED